MVKRCVGRQVWQWQAGVAGMAWWYEGVRRAGVVRGGRWECEGQVAGRQEGEGEEVAGEGSGGRRE